MVFLRFFILLV